MKAFVETYKSTKSQTPQRRQRNTMFTFANATASAACSPSGSISHWSRDLTADPRWPGRAGGARPPARLRNSESHPSRPLAVLLGLRVYASSVPRYSA